jgi:hypothetical protein
MSTRRTLLDHPSQPLVGPPRPTLRRPLAAHRIGFDVQNVIAAGKLADTWPPPRVRIHRDESEARLACTLCYRQHSENDAR